MEFVLVFGAVSHVISIGMIAVFISHYFWLKTPSASIGNLAAIAHLHLMRTEISPSRGYSRSDKTKTINKISDYREYLYNGYQGIVNIDFRDTGILYIFFSFSKLALCLMKSSMIAVVNFNCRTCLFLPSSVIRQYSEFCRFFLRTSFDLVEYKFHKKYHTFEHDHMSRQISSAHSLAFREFL